MSDPFLCTKEHPWNKGIKGPVSHDAAHEIEEQRDGYPGGDFVLMHCRNCDHTWETELPQ